MSTRFMRNAALANLAALALASGANAKELQKLENGIRVTPQAIAPVKMLGGQVVFGEWQPYYEPVGGCYGAEWFDSFDPDDTGSPEDEDGCGMGSARWFWGPSYCNGAAANDMTTAAAGKGGEATFTNFAWYWYVRGAGSRERCVIAVFTGDDSFDNCSDLVEWYAGIAYDFGDLASSQDQGYYFANMDLRGTGLIHQMPADGRGWYLVWYLRDMNGTLATCAQPMLWGTGGNRPGSQGELQYDDDNPRDGDFQLPDECYSYAYGLCPDPLAAMHSFGDGSNCGDGCTGAEDIIKASCRIKLDDTAVARIVLGDSRPGDSFCVRLDTGEERCGTINSRGRGKAKFVGVPYGPNAAVAAWHCGHQAMQSFSCGDASVISELTLDPMGGGYCTYEIIKISGGNTGGDIGVNDKVCIDCPPPGDNCPNDGTCPITNTWRYEKPRGNPVAWGWWNPPINNPRCAECPRGAIPGFVFIRCR